MSVLAGFNRGEHLKKLLSESIFSTNLYQIMFCKRQYDAHSRFLPSPRRFPPGLLPESQRPYLAVTVLHVLYSLTTAVQGYLAHKKQPPPFKDPHMTPGSPTVGS